MSAEIADNLGHGAEVTGTNETPEPLLRLEGIDTYYGQMHILQNVNLQVAEGEFVCLLGGNASGKSTTLKTILGIVPPRSGSVVLAGEDVTRMATIAKLKAGRLVREVADTAVQYHGGMGYVEENWTARFYRDARLWSIGGGADEVMLRTIARMNGMIGD